MNKARPDILAAIAAWIAIFWSAWRSGLQKLVPLSVRRVLEAEPHLVSIRRLPVGFEITHYQSSMFSGHRASQVLRTETIDEAVEQARIRRRRFGPLLCAEILIPEGQCLSVERLLPRSSVANAEKILNLDLERTTPLKRGDVFTGLIIEPEPDVLADRVLTRQLIAKKSTISALMRGLASHSIAVSRIGVVNDTGEQLPVNLMTAEGPVRRPLVYRVSKLAGLTVAVASISALVLLFVEIWRQETRLEQLNAEINVARQNAVSIAKRLAGTETVLQLASQVRLQKISKPPLVGLWEEVTQRLPMSAWLSQLQLNGAAMDLTGYAKSAPELIGALDRSPDFTDVQFSSPVVWDPREDMERFQIRLTVVGRTTDPTSKASMSSDREVP